MAIPGATNRERAAQDLLYRSGGTGAGAEMARSVLKQAEVLKTQPDSPAAQQIEQQIIQQTAKVYAEAATTGNQKGTITYQQLLQEQANYLAGKGVSTPEIQNLITKGIDTGIESGNTMIAGTQPSGFGTAVNVALGIGQALTTSGMGLQQQIIFNSAAALIQGAKPQDIVRTIVATVAADQIPKVLGEINKTIVNATPEAIQSTVKSAMVNAERQAVAAAITKQDIGKNALAGAVGGSVADLTGQGISAASPTASKSLSQALSRATAEYAQYKTAGFSDEEALQKAISGYVAQSQQIEAAAAKERQQTAGLTTEQVGLAQTYGQTAKLDSGQVGQYGQAGQYTGTESGANRLPPVTVTATSDTAAPSDLSIVPGARTLGATDVRSGGTKRLPTVTVTAQRDTAEPEDISVAATQTPAEEAQPKEQTPEKLRQDMILTSLINKNVSKPLYSNRAKTVTQQAGTPGTAALSQALRVGDIGAPIFGRDEEGRRAGWNLQSLRYMGDVGAEK